MAPPRPAPTAGAASTPGTASTPGAASPTGAPSTPGAATAASAPTTASRIPLLIEVRDLSSQRPAQTCAHDPSGRAADDGAEGSASGDRDGLQETSDGVVRVGEPGLHPHGPSVGWHPTPPGSVTPLVSTPSASTGVGG